MNYEKILQDVMKYYNKKKPDIPDRVLDKDANRIINIYKITYQNILNYLVSELSIQGDLSHMNHNTYMSMMTQIEYMLKSMEFEVRNEVTEVIEKEFIRGTVYHYAIINGVTDVTQILLDMPFSQINWNKANQLIEDTMEDLLYATSFTEQSIKRLVKDVVSKHLQLGALEGEAYKNIKKRITSELTTKGLSKTIKQKGFIGIIDKSGRKWNIITYTDMLVQTKMQQAYTEGLKEQAIQDGHDLAQIPYKSAKDSCKNFEGMVISMTGQTKGFYTYDQLKATGLIFHPRCRHTPFPVYSMDTLHPDDIKDHEKKMTDLKKLGKNKK